MTTQQFENQNFINLETFRRSGEGVRTPVWFAREGQTLHVWTQSRSGKAKRIRNNGSVRVVPCKSMGEPIGTWVDARASTDSSGEAKAHVTGLMRKKYGLQFRLANFFGKLRKAEYTTLKIVLPDEINS